MAQIFGPSSNAISRATIYGAVLILAAICWGGLQVQRSPYITQAGIVKEQPVPFSHEHHAGGLGIDCRYCHANVEVSAFAGMPATKVCMTCHSQIWNTAPMLAPVRQSWTSNRPLAWTRVNDLPDFAYFNHSIHVAKGVGCNVCHGPVDRMPLMYQEKSLQMEWCLDCHRRPEQYLRPKDQVFNMAYQAPPNQENLGRELVEKYHVAVGQLENCYVCHR